MATNYEESQHLIDEQIEDSNEQFWENIFQEKCNISLGPEGILYIQNHVENVVSTVVGRILESEKYRAFIEKRQEDVNITFYNQFNESHLLKVGSFYEGTKNSYPDEFDFIYVLAESSYEHKKEAQKLTSKLSDLFHDQLKEIFADPNFDLGYDFARCHLTKLHGPASKLKLEFSENSEVGNQTISVDLCTASRLMFEDGLPDDLNVFYDEWKEMILETGSVLLLKVYQTDHPKNRTDVKLTITETEQKFAKCKEFGKHRKVYRLLKHIFNGSEANEQLRDFIKKDNVDLYYPGRIFPLRQDTVPIIFYDLPSYTIKTLIFHHMHNCQNTSNKTTDCLYAVLDELVDIFRNHIDGYTTNNLTCKPAKFSVSIKSMLGHPLEIADEFDSALTIERSFSSLIKSVKRAQLDESLGQENSEGFEQFAEHMIETVQDAVGKRKELWPKPYLKSITILFIISALALVVYSFSQNENHNACPTNTSTTSNLTSNTQICCVSINNNSTGSMNRWSNGSCVKYDHFSGHRGTVTISTKLKQVFGNVILTEAKQGLQDLDDITDCIKDTEITDSWIGVCLNCKMSVNDSGMEDLGITFEEQCYSLIPCITDSNSSEIKEELSVCRNITDVKLVTTSSEDGNFSVRSIDTCYENKINETLSEICCKDSPSETDLPSDDCGADPTTFLILLLLLGSIFFVMVYSILFLTLCEENIRRLLAIRKMKIQRKRRQQNSDLPGIEMQQI